jgi:hypothetical protein
MALDARTGLGPILTREVGLLWGVRFPFYDEVSHGRPVPSPQLYEAALGVMVVCCAWAADRHFAREQRPRGVVTASRCPSISQVGSWSRSRRSPKSAKPSPPRSTWGKTGYAGEPPKADHQPRAGYPRSGITGRRPGNRRRRITSQGLGTREAGSPAEGRAPAEGGSPAKGWIPAKRDHRPKAGPPREGGPRPKAGPPRRRRLPAEGRSTLPRPPARPRSRTPKPSSATIASAIKLRSCSPRRQAHFIGARIKQPKGGSCSLIEF